MPTALSIGPLVASVFLTHGAWIDGCLWVAVALCCALAARGRSPSRGGMVVGVLATGAAVFLGSLALVAPTP